jgi:hypothetical protein
MKNHTGRNSHRIVSFVMDQGDSNRTSVQSKFLNHSVEIGKENIEVLNRRNTYKLRFSQDFEVMNINAKFKKDRIVPYYEFLKVRPSYRTSLKKIFTQRRNTSASKPVVASKRQSVIPNAYNLTRNSIKELGVDDLKASEKSMGKRILNLEQRLHNIHSRDGKIMSNAKKELYKEAYEKVKNNRFKYESGLRRRYDRISKSILLTPSQAEY